MCKNKPNWSQCWAKNLAASNLLTNELEKQWHAKNCSDSGQTKRIVDTFNRAGVFFATFMNAVILQNFLSSPECQLFSTNPLPSFFTPQVLVNCNKVDRRSWENADLKVIDVIDALKEK